LKQAGKDKLAFFRQSCLLCKGRRYKVIHRKASWRYLRCSGCGLVQLFPRPNSLQAEMVHEDYLAADAGVIKQWAAMMEPVIRQSAGLIEKCAPRCPGSLLDIGCGYGFFLHEMSQRGWHVRGIEISPAGRRHACRKLGLDVSGQSSQSLKWPAGQFDVVTLFYVVEHLPDPDAMLARIFRWLKPGGLILLRWPHTTPIVRFLGPLARQLDLYHTPYHFYDFSPRTLAVLLKKTGYKNIHTCIGGFTLPPGPAKNISSRIFGNLAEWLESCSGGRLLLPGVSKTTLAFKP
jgi:2-polyprenyl-3-methyl-5-hydroxy-6-metoxy-1,4-benzoquinol methylase